MSDALDWRENTNMGGGDENIKEYIHNLAWNGGNLVAKLWNTSLLFGKNQTAAMVNIEFPTTNMTIIKDVTSNLYSQYNITTGGFPWYNKYYIRLCTMVFHEISDFQYVAEAVISLLKQYSK